MKAAPAFQPNKKLILHFDLDFVIRLPPKADKDLLVSSFPFRCTSSQPVGFGENSNATAKKILTESQDGKSRRIRLVWKVQRPIWSATRPTFKTSFDRPKNNTRS